MKHEKFSLANVYPLDGCEIQWMSQFEGLESLSMSLTWPSMLQSMESSVEIMCERSEDVTKLPEIVNFYFPSSKYECSLFRFEHREPEGRIY